ncbi:MAG: hypothetical protein HC773_03155 [Scytonema sp. CRU_2_7]|nr:hypothetical protein [Scytonema sp. CRU_2_7]
MSDQNSSVAAKHTPEALQKKYSIKPAQYYERLKFLKIKAKKDNSGKAYLDDEQVSILDSLDNHIKSTGKMEGFSGGGQLVISAGRNNAAIASTVEVEIPETEPDIEGNFDGLVRRAQEIKAQSLVTPELVVLNLASQMTEDDLPEDLKQKVEEVRGAANPKYQHAQMATNLLAQYRASQSKS